MGRCDGSRIPGTPPGGRPCLARGRLRLRIQLAQELRRDDQVERAGPELEQHARARSAPRHEAGCNDGGINDREVWKFSHESGMRVIYMHEFCEMGLKAALAEARRVVGPGPTYLSFDIDSLDPAFAPGTGTPEVGGFTSLEAQTMIRALRGLDLVGADVVEVSPPFDPSGLTALTGASIMFELLCVLADAVAARKSRS